MQGVQPTAQAWWLWGMLHAASSRVATRNTRACKRHVRHDALQQPTVSGCPGQESYLQRMGCLHTISLWPSTYHLFGFIKDFALDFWLPQEPGTWFWGWANSHQRPSGSLAGRGKGEQSCFAPSETAGFPGRRTDTEVSTFLGTWADISQG